MKKYNLLFLFTLFILCLTACFKDDSAVNYKMVNPIRIDMGGVSTSYSLYALDTLEIIPIVYKEGVNDENLEFLWEVSGDLLVPTKIGDQMTLKIEFPFTPEANPYNLLYRITDKTTGIFVEQIFKVSVRSPYGGGLIVCDSEDGQNSDVSLIMAKCFNYKVDNGKDTVMRNLFSRVNLRKIDGIITSARSTFYSPYRTLTISTLNSIERVDPFDYSYMDNNGAMFYLDPKVYHVTSLSSDLNNGVDLMINDGKLYPRTFQNMNKLYTHYLLTNNLSDYRLSKMAKSHWNLGLAFDELKGRFLEISDFVTTLTTLERTIKESDPFKSTELSNFTCIDMFVGMDARIMHSILENKTTQRRYSYITKARAGYAKDAKDNGAPYGILDLNPSVCPNIDQATSFVATENQNVFYYADKKSIYSVGYASMTNLRVNVEYTAPEGEEITGLLAWSAYTADGEISYQNQNPNVPPEYAVVNVNSNNRMITVATYNELEREGFVRSIAITTPGIGKLEQDKKYHKEFRGFGKISHFVYQAQLK